MSQADLGRKSVLGREKSKGTRGGGCLVCLRATGKPTGEPLKLSEGMTVLYKVCIKYNKYLQFYFLFHYLLVLMVDLPH